MRAIGHFLVFIGFFLVFALCLGVVIVSAAALRSCLVCVLLLPVLPGLYMIYARHYRRQIRPIGGSRRRRGRPSPRRRRPALAASAR